MKTNNREEKYNRLGELLDLKQPLRFETIIMGLNLGLNILALDKVLERRKEYDSTKSMAQNVLDTYGQEAKELIEYLMGSPIIQS